jgi:hypothetical protein
MPTVEKSGGRSLRRVVLGLIALAAPGVCPSRAEDCKYFSALPDDCARAGLRKFDGLRDYRYEEIELFAKDPLKKVLYVTVYDTTGLNGGDDTQDSAPASLAQSLDPKKIAKQYQALSARIDPPYHWTMDLRRSQRGLDGKQLGAERRDLSQADSPRRVSSRLNGENGRRRLQERVGNLSARRPQGPDLGDGFLQGYAGPNDRQAQVPRRCPQAATGMEISHRRAFQ